METVFARRVITMEGGPKVVLEKRLQGLLGSDSNMEAQTGISEI